MLQQQMINIPDSQNYLSFGDKVALTFTSHLCVSFSSCTTVVEFQDCFTSIRAFLHSLLFLPSVNITVCITLELYPLENQSFPCITSTTSHRLSM